MASFTVPPSRRAALESVEVARAAPVARGVAFVALESEGPATPAAQIGPSAPAETVASLPEVSSAAVVAGPSDVPPPAEPPAPVVVVAPPPPPIVAPAPRPVVAPLPPPPVTTSSTSAVEARTLVLMNASRAQGGLAALVADAGVSSVARAHSAVEARVRDLWHDGIDGTARARDGGACGSGWYGENTGRIWNGNADALNAEFMAEPWAPINHRTNIMDPNFRRVGIGAVQGPDAIYATIVFCR